MRMHWVILLSSVAVGANLIAADKSRLEETRETLAKWVETKQLVSRTKSDWENEKHSLDQSILLFERELRSIEEQMSKLSTNNTQVEKERLQAETLQKTSTEALDKTREFSSSFESRLKEAVPKLPVPLRDILKPLIARLPADPAGTRMTAGERMQLVVGILNEIDKFNSGVNLFSEKRRNPAGEEVSVETVYLGLGAAYFVNDATDFAGVGTPGADGWDWTTKSELAPTIREIIRIYRNERPARFVALPASIK